MAHLYSTSMNLLKSIFISFYATAAIVLTILASLWLWRHQGGLQWIGLLLIFAPMGLFFAVLLLLRNRARSHPLLPAISLATGAGLLLTVVGWARAEPRPHALLGIGVAGVIGYLLYVFWYSRFGRTPSPQLRMGGVLPDFEARDSQGEPFRSAELRGKPAVLLFFRGNWCPLCMAQINEIAGGYRELADLGANVVLISPQSESNSRRLAGKFSAPMRFIVDEGNRVARQFGIAAPFGAPAGLQILGYKSETVLPTAIVIDAEGRILLSDQTDNYRIRPEPETFLAVLRGA